MNTEIIIDGVRLVPVELCGCPACNLLRRIPPVSPVTPEREPLLISTPASPQLVGRVAELEKDNGHLLGTIDAHMTALQLVFDAPSDTPWDELLAKARDLKAALELAELYIGRDVRHIYERAQAERATSVRPKCERCSGTGKLEAEWHPDEQEYVQPECEDCEGSGRLTSAPVAKAAASEHACQHLQIFVQRAVCKACGARLPTCSVCHGSGHKPSPIVDGVVLSIALACDACGGTGAAKA